MTPAPKQFLYRSEPYKKWIRTQPCLVSGRTPCEACHFDVLKSGGMAIRGHDSQCLPLAMEYHREAHQIGQDTFCDRYPWIDIEKEIIRHLTRYMQERKIK